MVDISTFLGQFWHGFYVHSRKLAIKNRVKVLRAERDWTQERLAKAIGVSRHAINALENGRHDPSLDLAFLIATVFEVSIDQAFLNPKHTNMQTNHLEGLK